MKEDVCRCDTKDNVVDLQHTWVTHKMHMLQSLGKKKENQYENQLTMYRIRFCKHTRILNVFRCSVAIGNHLFWIRLSKD